MDASSPGSVAAVVVHYRTPERLRECVAALERQGDACAEIVVVDNSSSVDPLAPPHPDAAWRLLQTTSNLGFGAACNLGASVTHSDYLLFINADVVLDERACETLRAFAEDNPRTAVVGPRIRGADGKTELSARTFPTLMTGVLGRSTTLTRVLRGVVGPPKQVAHSLTDHTTNVDWISGACMLVRRQPFEEVGGFDEGYWMYWEDADLCRRLSEHGWSTAFCVEATAKHSTGASGQNDQTLEAFHRSAARYHRRHIARSGATAAIARAILMVRMRVMLSRSTNERPTGRLAARRPSGSGHAVIIDALAARFGGTAYATVQLARQLSEREDVSSVSVVTRADSIVAKGLAADARVTCIVLPASPRIELLRRLAWEALRLPALVAREEHVVVVSMSGMLPRSPGGRVICLLLNPVMYESRSAANALRRWAVRRTAREADYLAAPSRAVAERVAASTRRRCEVVPLGIDHEIFRPADRQDTADEILCVADFYRHKRHQLLLEAWLRLRAPRPTLRLIGSGAVDPQAYDELLARIRALPDASPIALESNVPLERLVAAYHRARVFMLASEHESFSMPLAEAMACGVPAVVRGLASLRETGATGARYVDGDDPAEWAAAVQELIDDHAMYRLLSEAALASAARFSWRAFAGRIAAHFQP